MGRKSRLKWDKKAREYIKLMKASDGNAMTRLQNKCKHPDKVMHAIFRNLSPVAQKIIREQLKSSQG